ncbi:MAG: T9SS type A sorting domain-containing protein, partial [Calditrichaeota bacterium]|nr:T9SS type A sorting domain-containing protein [Calditrichota bacterium]
SQDFVLTLDATGLPVGITFEAELRFYHNASGGVFNLLIALEVLGGERSLELDLMEGWNLISINVEPENLDVRELLGTLTDEDKVIIFKNGIGQFYLPERNFINIDGWDVSDGYQINMAEASLWEARGAPIPADQPIQLVEGWNMKAYFPTQPIDAIAALAGIADQLIIAKDVFGAFYLAEFGFSNMGDLSEGQGYQYKMSEPAELIYQVGEELAWIETAVSGLQHFETLSPTGVDMSILLVGNPTMSDQEIGVYSSGGQLIGSGKIDSDGNCGIAARGDDISTVVVDGAGTDEKLFFKLWDGVDETDLNITVKSGEVSWANGGILIGDIEPVSTTPATFGIHETYPNPTNGPMKLLFGLEADSRISVTVSDLSGRLVETLVRGEYKAGHHQLIWDTDVVPSGLYLVKLSAPGMKQTIKAAVLK